jgi:putative ABC transport system permease protein
VTNRFVLANLWHRPVRALASVLAVSLEVLLILMIVGFCRGMIVDSAQRQQGIGADIFLQPPNASLIFTTGGVLMPISDAEKLRPVPGIRAVAPVLYQVELEDGLVTIFGIDLQSFNDLEAQSKRLKVGMKRQFKGQDFQITGVVQHGKGARVFMPIETMQNLLGRSGKASMMFIRCDDPSRTDEVIRSIQTVLPDHAAFSVKDWVTRIQNTNPPALDVFLGVVVGVAVIVGSFAIFLSLYTTIAERTRDIGILKSLGASKIYILNLILRESLVLCVLGFVLGLILTEAGRGILKTAFPTQDVIISYTWVLRAALLVLISGVLGAVYPALQAAGKDPIRALAYE